MKCLVVFLFCLIVVVPVTVNAQDAMRVQSVFIGPFYIENNAEQKEHVIKVTFSPAKGTSFIHCQPFKLYVGDIQNHKSVSMVAKSNLKGEVVFKNGYRGLVAIEGHSKKSFLLELYVPYYKSKGLDMKVEMNSQFGKISINVPVPINVNTVDENNIATVETLTSNNLVDNFVPNNDNDSSGVVISDVGSSSHYWILFGMYVLLGSLILASIFGLLINAFGLEQVFKVIGIILLVCIGLVFLFPVLIFLLWLIVPAGVACCCCGGTGIHK